MLGHTGRLLVGKEECVDIGGHMKAREHDSLYALRYCARPGPHTPGTLDNSKPKTGPSELNGYGRGRHRNTPGIGPSPSQGSLANDGGVVQSGRRTRSEALPTYHQADHGVEG